MQWPFADQTLGPEGPAKTARLAASPIRVRVTTKTLRLSPKPEPLE